MILRYRHKESTTSILIQLKTKTISKEDTNTKSLSPILEPTKNNNINHLRNKGFHKAISLLIYNIQSEKMIEDEAYLKVISNLDGFAEININCSLYLCGSSDNNEGNNAFLLHINIKTTHDVEILINSQYPHVYPSLAFIEPQLLLVVGGLNQLSCEAYDINASKWLSMPELPEERYLCAVVVNPLKTHAYLFGGYCSEINSNVSKSILRLLITAPLVWEKIIIKENDGLLRRNSCAGLVILQSNNIILLGGRNDLNEEMNDIIEFDPTKFIPQKCTMTLHSKTSFKNQSGCNIDHNDFYLFDSIGFLHKLNVSDLSLK